MKLHAYDHFAVDQLIRDMKVASEGWDWSQGAHGHSLFLTAREDLHPAEQDRYINVPFSEERITLVMDFFKNDWLRARYPAILEGA